MGKTTKELDNIILTTEDNIATIMFNRPKALNAISPDFMRDFEVLMDMVTKDETIRAVIITGAGKSFCAGGDVGEDVAMVSEMTPLQYKKYVSDFYEPIKQLMWLDKPVIAAIRGYAIGGGLDIALACDIRIVTPGARLGSAYRRMGIVPEMGGVYFLPRLIGIGNAKLLAYTGDFIFAEEAYRMGLVEKVVPEEELDKAAWELADTLAKGPTKTIAMTKRAINKSLDLDIDTSTEYCWDLNLLLLQTEDHHEAFTAFLEKRPPNFKGC